VSVLLPVVLLVATAVIVGGVVVVAIGRGGEMAPFTADLRPLDTEIVTAADVALLRPPAALWGYDMRATDEALNMVARTVTERDVEIATLRRQLADLQSAATLASGRVTEPAQEADLTAPGSPPGQPPAAPAVPLPPVPLRRGGGSHARPADDKPSWSAWERPRPAGLPEHREPPASGPGEST